MGKVILYIHGKGGDAEEAEHYKALCAGYDVYGLDYKAQTPWEAKEKIVTTYGELSGKYDSVLLLANSIGAFFAMHALQDRKVEKAFFISPVIDMESLIYDMMSRAGISEQELYDQGEITTDFGETLSWAYLQYVRNTPISWTAPTAILYAGKDQLTSRRAIDAFVKAHDASLTVMENGEHWFHTGEQTAFLDAWFRRNL